jgi:ATP-binding cassette, subfamily B, bacterial
MTKKTLTLIDSLAFHWRHAMKYRSQVAVSFIVGPLSIIAERYIAPLFIAGLLTAIQLGNATIENAVWLLVGYGILQILAFVIGYRINLYAMWSVQIYGGRDVTQEAYESLTSHSLQFHNNRFAGSLVSQVNKTSAAFFSFWNMIVFEVLFAVVSIVATLIGVGLISWPLAIILTIFIIIYIIIAFFGTRFMRPRQVARSKAYSKISGQLSDSISNMVAVKVESNENREKRLLDATLAAAIEREKHVRSGVMTIMSLTSLAIAFARIAALLVAVWAVQSHSIDAGAVYLLITFTLNLLMEMSNISNTFRTVYQISGDTEEMLGIMNEQIDITDNARTKLNATAGEISIANLTFSHDEGDALFNNLSLHIPAGQKVGIVGVSGSGKTTLTKLLLRLTEPQSGSITIDGQAIAEVSLRSLHKAIAYVTQEPLLFHRSLKENIAYARPSATDAEISKAAKQAQAYDFITKLPDEFNTLVGERGVKLSGGQRQRVAIARAILKDAPILVLDEATSALDSESEQLIQTALESLMENRTSVVVAHRLSTIAKLDRIIVMDNGTIVEDGSHAELIAKNGRYAKLWSHQSGGFIEA